MAAALQSIAGKLKDYAEPAPPVFNVTFPEGAPGIPGGNNFDDESLPF